jgi:hypothetical protein
MWREVELASRRLEKLKWFKGLRGLKKKASSFVS